MREEKYGKGGNMGIFVKYWMCEENSQTFVKKYELMNEEM
jgi:hypothetical protein